MKTLTLLALALLAANAQAAELRLTGAAAAELYASLALNEVNVSDEHGGNVFAVAKYGKNLGCQKELSSGAVECWIK